MATNREYLQSILGSLANLQRMLPDETLDSSEVDGLNEWLKELDDSADSLAEAVDDGAI